MLEEAIKKHRAGDHAGAAQLYREALDAEPGRHDIHHLLALAYRDQKELDRALEHAERAIDLAEGDEAAYYQTLGAVLHAQGDLAGARSNLERAVEIDPNLKEGYNTLGFLQFAQRDYDAAEQSLRLALKSEPDSPAAYTNLGNVQLARGDLEKARASFNRALELDPQSVAARASLGRALLMDGAAAFAEECFRRCLEARPDSRELQVLLAQAVLANGRHEEADVAFDEILAEEPGRFDALVGKGDCMAMAQRPREAVRFYTQALMQRRGHAMTLEKLADALFASEDLAAARQCYESLVERGYPARGLRARLARVIERQGDLAGAIQTVQTALSDDAGDLDAALILAQLHARQGEHEESLKVLDALPAELQDRNRTCIVRARALLALARPGEALESLTPIASESQYILEALELRGRAHDALEEHAAAAEAFAQAAAKAETPPPEVPTPVVDAETAGDWPKEPPEDGRGEPVFLLGLPGSGIESVADALAALSHIEVLSDRFGKDGRRDFLSERDAISGWADMDEDDVLRQRRRYWHAVRRARASDEAGIAALDRLPPAQTDPVAIARFFPQATLVIVQRHPGDHLLHTESFAWRQGEGATGFDLADFYGNLKAAGALGLKLIWVDFDALRDGDHAPLVALFSELDVPFEGFGEALKNELYSQDGLPRYWPAGHWAAYREGLDFDVEQVAEVAASLGYEQGGDA